MLALAIHPYLWLFVPIGIVLIVLLLLGILNDPEDHGV